MREQQLRVAADRGEQVVEVVRDAAGEPADALEPLRAPEVALELFALGHVAQDGDVQARQDVRACRELDLAHACRRAGDSYCPRRAVSSAAPALDVRSTLTLRLQAEQLVARPAEELAGRRVGVDVSPSSFEMIIASNAPSKTARNRFSLSLRSVTSTRKPCSKSGLPVGVVHACPSGRAPSGRCRRRERCGTRARTARRARAPPLASR